jgi:hypothetical protein
MTSLGCRNLLLNRVWVTSKITTQGLIITIREKRDAEERKGALLGYYPPAAAILRPRETGSPTDGIDCLIDESVSALCCHDKPADAFAC